MVDELSIYVPDRAGELARILQLLKDADVNILGLTIDEVQSVSIARFIVDAPEIAKNALEEKNLTVSVSKVFTVRLAHAPGALHGIVATLAKAKINIRYIYVMQQKNSPDPVIVLRVPPRKEKETKDVLEKHKFAHVRLKDLMA